MALIEMSDYALPAIGIHRPLQPFDFSLAPNDVCRVDADTAEDAQAFIRAVATLFHPVSGTYRYRARRLNFGDYRAMLPIKKEIGYIGPHAALICNRSLRDNLIMMRSYFENTLVPTLDEETAELCHHFRLTGKLGLRPVDLELADIRAAIAVRELCKNPAVLLVENPEDYIGYANLAQLVKQMNNVIGKGRPVVYTCGHEDLVRTAATRTLSIKNGMLRA